MCVLRYDVYMVLYLEYAAFPLSYFLHRART